MPVTRAPFADLGILAWSSTWIAFSPRKRANRAQRAPIGAFCPALRVDGASVAKKPTAGAGFWRPSGRFGAGFGAAGRRNKRPGCAGGGRFDGVFL